MFRIIKDGASVGMTEAPNFIRQQENGCFALCPEPMASGIVFEGTVYHLLGRDALNGVESVILEETDAGAEITKANATGGIMFVTLAEAGTIDDEKRYLLWRWCGWKCYCFPVRGVGCRFGYSPDFHGG